MPPRTDDLIVLNTDLTEYLCDREQAIPTTLGD